jgi:hypothetical protein
MPSTSPTVLNRETKVAINRKICIQFSRLREPRSPPIDRCISNSLDWENQGRHLSQDMYPILSIVKQMVATYRKICIQFSRLNNKWSPPIARYVSNSLDWTTNGRHQSTDVYPILSIEQPMVATNRQMYTRLNNQWSPPIDRCISNSLDCKTNGRHQSTDV